MIRSIFFLTHNLSFKIVEKLRVNGKKKKKNRSSRNRFIKNRVRRQLLEYFRVWKSKKIIATESLQELTKVL